MDGERTVDAPVERNRIDKGRVGIIDVGSNSIRLVVYERASRAPLPVFNEKVLCGLARGLDATGRLNPAGVELALANIDRFVTLAHNMKVKSLDLLATAAVRDAADGAEFMRQLASRPGLRAHVVSGQDEARFSGYGVMCGIPNAVGVMGDLGGGSLELVALGNGRIGASTTLPIGPLRLMSSGKSDPKRIVVEAIENVRWLREETGKTFYAVGGAWRAFARLHMEQAGYPLHIIHQYDIPTDEARAVARLIAVQSAKSLEKMPGVSRRRVETLPLACLALDRLLGALKPRNVVFSAFGLREGFYYSRLAQDEQARHPLIAFAEEQGQDWRRFDLAPTEIFDWLTPAFAGESDVERTLRLAACHLSDISWDDHPDYRADQAYVRVLHLPAPGMNHRERAILAMALAYRYKSDPKSAMLDTALKLSDGKGRAFARRLGACLRLAYNLSGGAPGLLPQIQLRRTERDLRLLVPAQLTRSLGDVTARRLESAAEAFDLKSAILSL
ncbi:exopolyphosphatase / guanosine-5'-triphosphate,3'-diphosphate pyrophosphatase [Enhydrobacter aerosaccus]|uniref:Exopolyphosphatase / guanosine-5'-triphosphate,3'-diphosphate pyrophosphatase n=1 Tax=Enhydrobacter aerosaccus TaxID=225324 RepID=A0A1T4KL99_9HYPH|nr:Ppx/GppA family phosphatase [Enhydrobacter aerosaccus]SJZ43158.1 exopolyphosphatase / guanosine-5'-triphosphate,3'-diphosphate pyrophosphatase [Enhydrobacter aerosaccus]